MLKRIRTADKIILDKVSAASFTREEIVSAFARRLARKLKVENPDISLDSVKTRIMEVVKEKFKEAPELGSLLSGLEKEITAGYDETPETSKIASLMETCDWLFSEAPNSFTVAHSLLEFDKPNRNKDFIPLDEAEALVKYMPGQGVTWQHNPEIIIGAIVGSAVDWQSKVLCCSSRLWIARFNLDNYTEACIKAYEDGSLAFSFEMLFTEAECSVCHRKFPAMIPDKNGEPTHDHYCSHLKSRIMPGSECYRIIRGVIPQGEGVVDVPAFAGSTAFIAASVTEETKFFEILSQIEEKIGIMEKNII